MGIVNTQPLLLQSYQKIYFLERIHHFTPANGRQLITKEQAKFRSKEFNDWLEKQECYDTVHSRHAIILSSFSNIKYLEEILQIARVEITTVYMNKLNLP